jgi:predicted MFS family arabinose efflux permease
VVGGALAPRLIARIGSRSAIVVGFVVQAGATLPLAFLDGLPGWLVVLVCVTFAGGVANLVAIVGFMVTATAGLPDDEQGLATGLATMSQQVGITLGTPVMSAIATAGGASASGISTALAVNAGVGLAAAVLVAVALPRER